ncbi:MAG TPA: hypothetical protein VNM90_06960 [Haliangium sp.]|nr:hypothetical protein [Haliangium sp.]
MEPGAPAPPPEPPPEASADEQPEAIIGAQAQRPPLVRAGKLPAYDQGLPGHRPPSPLTAITGLTAATGAALFLGTISAGLIPGLLTAGTGVAIFVHRRRQHQRMARILGRLSRFRPVRASELAAVPEGAPVRVRGRVRAANGTLAGVLDPERRGAWRALFIHEAVLRQRLLFVEHGWDFDLRDDSGVPVRVQVTRARLLLALIEQMPWTLEFAPVQPAQLGRLVDAVPDAVRGRRAFDPAHLRSWEYVLADGAEVDVFGFATRVIGPGASALPREAPQQPALTGRDEHVLVIVPREA